MDHNLMPDIAVISDIHGNRWALEAVLDHIRRRGIQAMVNLGDSLYGPLDPAGTAQILMELDIPTVRGNEDRILHEEPGRHSDSPSLPFVRSRLLPEQMRWLQALPLTVVVHEDFFLCHGSPKKDTEYLLREVTALGPRVLSSQEVETKLKTVAQPIILCGHDHLPTFMSFPDGRHVINPGSVGLPAYRDHAPFPHAMEAGSPHARYAVVKHSGSGLIVEHISLSYDWQGAAETAARNGRPDWAGFLATGRAS